jgi:hypothetical protein
MTNEENMLEFAKILNKIVIDNSCMDFSVNREMQLTFNYCLEGDEAVISDLKLFSK